MDWTELVLFVAIIVIASTGMIAKLKVAKRVEIKWKWINYGFAGVCVLWITVYGIVLVLNLLRVDESLSIRNYLIRPAIVLTLSFIAASGIARLAADEC